MIFKRVNDIRRAKASKHAWTALFQPDNWDDWNYKTSFFVRLLSPTGDSHDLGSVKVGAKGITSYVPIDQHPLPNEFTQLEDSFFSVGQDVAYYSTLKELGDDVRNRYLTAMRDIALTPSLLEDFKDEGVLDTSLFRSVHTSLLKTQFNRLAHGLNRLEAFGFAYHNSISQRVDLRFDVEPESVPPTNVHVLIGSNGVGKTTLLHRLCDVARFPSSLDADRESFGFVHSQDGTDAFWNLVAIAFSAFDSFGTPPAEVESSSVPDVNYYYFGLKTPSAVEESEQENAEVPHKSTDDLVDDFRALLNVIAKSRKGQFERFAQAIKILSSDPLIGSSLFREEFDEADFLPSPDIDPLVECFSEMSSGHKIVLLSLAGLVTRVDEKTLVLIDEPETHLHPPLLSAYIRAVSNLLIERNGVAIVATHSPVVLQEVPKSCVWKLNRSGEALQNSRPAIETFGESVGTLTREVFGLEVTKSGFFQMLSDITEEHDTYEEVLDALGEQLGAEGRALVRILLAERLSK